MPGAESHTGSQGSDTPVFFSEPYKCMAFVHQPVSSHMSVFLTPSLFFCSKEKFCLYLFGSGHTFGIQNVLVWSSGMFASCNMVARWRASHEDMEQDDQLESLSFMETTHTHGSSTPLTLSNRIASRSFCFQTPSA